MEHGQTLFQHPIPRSRFHPSISFKNSASVLLGQENSYIFSTAMPTVEFFQDGLTRGLFYLDILDEHWDYETHNKL